MTKLLESSIGRNVVAIVLSIGVLAVVVVVAAASQGYPV